MDARSALSVRFLGAAAQTVTGSKYLLSQNGRALLIDCGLFQGLKRFRLQNWAPFPCDPKRIDAVVLTRAHIDHSGYLPRLVKEGFAGKIFCTEGTQALAETMLLDTGLLQEEDAEYLNKKAASKHHPALPLFTRSEAEAALKQFENKAFGENFEPVPGFRCCFLYAGHALGAASLVVRVGQRTIAFSGNVGRSLDPVFYPPTVLPPVDYLVLESNFGDRLHSKTAPMFELAQIIKTTVEKDGVVLIPAFAPGKAQPLLYFLSQLRKQKRIPDIPIYLNSPMAHEVIEAFIKFRSLHKLTESECREMLEGIRIVSTLEESKDLNGKKGPMLIVAAGGMATGGRILHHLKTFAPDKTTAIVLTGFQAEGTRGNDLAKGAKEIRIHGQTIPIRARVHTLENLSAHADRSEILAWLAKSRMKPKRVYVTHGEPSAAAAMCSHIETAFNWTCTAPSHLQQETLD